MNSLDWIDATIEKPEDYVIVWLKAVDKRIIFEPCTIGWYDFAGGRWVLDNYPDFRYEVSHWAIAKGPNGQTLKG